MTGPDNTGFSSGLKCEYKMPGWKKIRKSTETSNFEKFWGRQRDDPINTLLLALFCVAEHVAVC